MSGFNGGTRLVAKLEQIGKDIQNATSLRMGFLEDSTQPDGTPNAYIAIIQEYGATINAAARTQIIYRKPRKLRKGSKGHRFVKASSKGAVAKEVDVGAHTIVIPARPFFRAMIAANQGTWGPTFAKLLKRSNYSMEAALKALGEIMGDQLQKSLASFTSPPNAKSTIRKKGRDRPLFDRGNLYRGVGSDVS